ncbi:MAG: hypothetical protein JWN31_877 [Frankiales bacterium]|nr:hypothetical protein [Frankiales bacterium]
MAALLLSLVVLTGCQASHTTLPSPSPTPPPTTPAPTVSPTPPPSAVPSQAWVVGASPLPIGPDGFGKVLPTPQVLRDRHLPTKDILKPPADGRFHSTVGPITPSLRERMGDTYRVGCPVGLADLRYLTLTFRGFDTKVHTGELVVAASVSAEVTRSFSRLFALGFPIEEMRLPTTADVTAKPTGDGNDTAGFVCRAARGQKRFSAHAYGLAIDVNPFHNPYVKGDLVLPELASAYRDRSWVRDGMFEPGSAAVRAFTREGWTWGGTFSRPKDYQHMSKTGN